MVLTGGTSALPGIRQLASQVLGIPVRTAGPEKLVGLVDQLKSPALFHQCRPAALGCRLIRRRMSAQPVRADGVSPRKEIPVNLDPVKDWFKRLLP